MKINLYKYVCFGGSGTFIILFVSIFDYTLYIMHNYTYIYNMLYTY